MLYLMGIKQISTPSHSLTPWEYSMSMIINIINQYFWITTHIYSAYWTPN